MTNVTPNIFALIALFGIIPFTLVLFALLPARRAVATGAIAAWLLLPSISINLPGLPDYDKAKAATAGILLATLVFEPNRLLTFRLRWFDVPMLLWSLCPFVSSVANGLGAYDGLSAVVRQTTSWFLPYFIGRLYLSDVEGMRELGRGMIVGALCLIPLCLLELKLSPILQGMVYGFGSWEGERYGGYRPRVFFKSSLELGLWMHAATLVAWWFWRTGQFKRLGGLAGMAIVASLLITSIACKTTGSTILFLTGMAALWICWRTKTKWMLWGLLCVAPIYYAVRISDIWSGHSAVELVRLTLNEARAQSLEFRLDNEALLIAKALHQPFFGWGGWSRSFIFDEWGRGLTVVDGMWMVTLGNYGCVGLVLMATALLLPAVRFLSRFPVERWADPSLAPVVPIAVIVDIYLLDGLVNGMLNVIYIIAAGGLVNIVPARTKPQVETAARSTNSREILVGQYQSLGRSLKDQGRFAEAKNAWLNALDLLNEESGIRPVLAAARRQWCDCANDLAWLLVNAPDPAVQDPAHAFSLALQAAEVLPECSTYWNTLGAVHYRAGDFKAALIALDRSTGARPRRYGLRPLLSRHDSHPAWKSRTSSALVRPGHALDETTSLWTC